MQHLNDFCTPTNPNNPIINIRTPKPILEEFIKKILNKIYKYIIIKNCVCVCAFFFK